MMKKKKIISLLMVSIFLLTACGTDTTTEVYEGQELHYQSSDEGLSTFLNEFYHRNMRYDEYAAGDVTVAGGTGFQKNWEAMGTMWHNATSAAIGEDKIQRVYNWLAAIDQDDLGMIYNTGNYMDGYLSEAGVDASIPQGWPFPTWNNSAGDHLSFGKDYSVGSTTFEFNDLKDWQSEKWVAEGGKFEIVENTGYASFSSDALDEGESFRFYRTDISELERFEGIGSQYSPFVEIAMSFSSYNLDDYYIIWQTKEGGDEWYSVAHNAVATSENNDFKKYNDRTYMQMYLAENWDGQIITALGIEFRPKEGEMLTVTGGNINYIRCQYDTRQTNSTLQWLLALSNYANYTQNLDELAELMPTARRALLFLTHVLEGENGLVNISYLYGHNGIGMYKKEDGTYNFDTANGIGNGYFDLIVPSEIDLETNVYFYQVLTVMADMEQKLADAGVEVEETSVIRNRMPGEQDITYQYTADSILALKEQVKENIEKEIKPVQQEDGSYQNEGGFWNSETGRFAAGINEETGAVADYGYVYWNLQLICAGLGTDEQQLSVMEWIDGQRIVEGDTSTGDDIYFYEFAPRYNTKDNYEHFASFVYSVADNLISQVGTSWSRQVQNGGAVLAWSYYDLVARAKVLGADNAYERLKEIQGWYEKVSAETTGEGYDFYSGYYDNLAAEAEEKYLMEDDASEHLIWTLQQSPQQGAIGLDAEFVESIILIKAIPDAFFGMEANGSDSVVFRHNMPSEVDVLQMDNLKYGNCLYSIKGTKNSLEVLNAIGTVEEKQTITFCFEKPAILFGVYINGEKTKDYAIEDGMIYVTVPFDNVNVTVK